MTGEEIIRQLEADGLLAIVETCCTRYECGGKPGPSHNGSRLCRSGSIASGGTRDHCSCQACW